MDCSWLGTLAIGRPRSTPEGELSASCGSGEGWDEAEAEAALGTERSSFLLTLRVLA